MTNNEQIKCPVCGEGALERHLDWYKCHDCEIDIPVEVVNGYLARIDKAVQEDRERILTELDKEKPLTVLMPAMYQKIIKIINMS